MRRTRRSFGASALEQIAGNGLLHRRALLHGGVAFAGALTAGPALTAAAAADPLDEPEWSLAPGDVTPALQKPSRFEAKVVRTLSNPKGDARTQHARAPLQMLEGTITPNPLQPPRNSPHRRHLPPRRGHWTRRRRLVSAGAKSFPASRAGEQ